MRTAKVAAQKPTRRPRPFPLNRDCHAGQIPKRVIFFHQELEKVRIIFLGGCHEENEEKRGTKETLIPRCTVASDDISGRISLHVYFTCEKWSSEAMSLPLTQEPGLDK